MQTHLIDFKGSPIQIGDTIWLRGRHYEVRQYDSGILLFPGLEPLTEERASQCMRVAGEVPDEVQVREPVHTVAGAVRDKRAQRKAFKAAGICLLLIAGTGFLFESWLAALGMALILVAIGWTFTTNP